MFIIRSYSVCIANQQLEKQKADLQADVQKANQSSKDDETKQKEIEQLPAQIQQIEARIEQRENGSQEQPAAARTDTVTISPEAAALFNG